MIRKTYEIDDRMEGRRKRPMKSKHKKNINEWLRRNRETRNKLAIVARRVDEAKRFRVAADGSCGWGLRADVTMGLS